MTNRVLDSLPNLLGPVIQIIGEAVGMHISVLIGGPEPQKKGQLNMIGYVAFILLYLISLAETFGRIHHGENKAAIPKVWALAEKDKFKVVKEAFIAFLSTCYSKCHHLILTVHNV